MFFFHYSPKFMDVMIFQENKFNNQDYICNLMLLLFILLLFHCIVIIFAIECLRRDI